MTKLPKHTELTSNLNLPFPHSPSPVKQTIFYYNILTWASLLIFSGLVIWRTEDSNYWFIVPVFLYSLTLITLPRISYRPNSSSKWNWHKSIGIRRTSGSTGRRALFIFISFSLIFWLNWYSPYFISMYFILFGHTIGLFELHWSLPLIGLEVLALLAQNGLFATTSRIGSEGLWTLGVSLFLALPNIIIVSFLISARVKSEILVQELTQTKRKLEETLLKEKELAVLRERDRMASEMHDVLGHALVLIAVKIEAAQRLQPVDPIRANGELESTKELVRQSMAELRASLAELRSPALQTDTKSLVSSLQEWAELTARDGQFKIKTNFADADYLPIPQQDALWRVGREALLNIVKHAQAGKVEVNLFFKDNQVFLSILDDGIGIPHLADGKARLEVEGHYGMRGMRERLEALGGNLSVKPGYAECGTLLVASLPIISVDLVDLDVETTSKFTLVKNRFLR